MRIEPDPSRVQFDLTGEQAELLRDCLLTQVEQNPGQRNKILMLHEQVMGALSERGQPRKWRGAECRLRWDSCPACYWLRSGFCHGAQGNARLQRAPRCDLTLACD